MYILGALRAPEITQEDASKARFNTCTEQLDRMEVERGKLGREDRSKQQEGAIAAVQEGRGQQIRRMIVARKAIETRALQSSERASTEAAEQTLRVAGRRSYWKRGKRKREGKTGKRQPSGRYR